jgi:hypothetical protein
LPRAINTSTALASTQKAIISYRIGKRDGADTDDFVQDLRGRVLGTPEISTDGWHPYKLECHAAAVSLYVAHYNWCRVHETLTPDARHQTTASRWK